MINKTNRYFRGKTIENSISKVFQTWYNEKNNCLTFLEQRKNKQAPVDFLGRSYDSETKKTIVELAVEVRSLYSSREQLLDIKNGMIDFPISKLNELMMFWRMDKEVYIVYKLADDVYMLNFDYYIKHNFEIREEKLNGGYKYVKIPVHSFIHIGKYKELRK